MQTKLVVRQIAGNRAKNARYQRCQQNNKLLIRFGAAHRRMTRRKKSSKKPRQIRNSVARAIDIATLPLKALDAIPEWIAEPVAEAIGGDEARTAYHMAKAGARVAKNASARLKGQRANARMHVPNHEAQGAARRAFNKAAYAGRMRWQRDFMNDVPHYGFGAWNAGPRHYDEPPYPHAAMLGIDYPDYIPEEPMRAATPVVDDFDGFPPDPADFMADPDIPRSPRGYKRPYTDGLYIPNKRFKRGVPIRRTRNGRKLRRPRARIPTIYL